MNNEAVKKFFGWYKDWYKSVQTKIHIMFSVPNELHLEDFLRLIKEQNVVVLELFEKIDQSTDAKIYLQQICSKADELGISLYLEPMPRIRYFKENSEKKNKITKEYLVGYYTNFGFEPILDNRFMKRLPI